MIIKIEKRVPFGFKGIWGKCYKLTNYNDSYTYSEPQIEAANTELGENLPLEDAETTNHTIIYQRVTYYDIGADIQFKLLEDGVDKSVNNTQPISNLVTKGEYRTIKTTDAQWKNKKYECICQPNDIIYFENDYWVVEKIDERSVYNPNRQTFYYLSIRKIFDEIITGEN